MKFLFGLSFLVMLLLISFQNFFVLASCFENCHQNLLTNPNSTPDFIERWKLSKTALTERLSLNALW